tara:strand:+ start:503 stop:748 length:246 start_codon:yes stop_codon:yes gene_type:complete
MLTNPKDRDRLINGIKELSDSMARVAAEKDLQKNIVEDVADDTEVDKKYIRKLATIYHKQTFVKVQEETDEIVSLYDILFS